MTENINHTTYPKMLRSKSIDSLKFIISDCQAALKANPTCGKAGYYADEIAYAGMELKRRNDVSRIPR